MMKNCRIVVLRLGGALCAMSGFVSCGGGKAADEPLAMEDKYAKALFQGIWIDEETESVVFRVEGDTVYYPDAINMPMYFSIVGDTLMMGSPSIKYPIQKQTADLFWFRNPNGDIIKLAKSRDTISVLAFGGEQPEPVAVSEVVKRDTVVVYGGERYHCYVAVNPTQYKVLRMAFNDDGVAVENVYYDNIVHLSVFHGARQVYSRDFKKAMFDRLVPEQFLSQAILSDIVFDGVTSDGFHFHASLCMPDAASCYVVDTRISFDGEMEMELVD